jgi:hypothetical protein
MKRKWIIAGAGLILAALGTGPGAAKLLAARPQAAAAATYTTAEYNAYTAAHGEANPQMKLQKLQDFIKMYPNSTLMPYINSDMYQTEFAVKNYSGTADYVDKVLAMGDKLEATSRLQACVVRAQAYGAGAGSDKALQTPDAQTKARSTATDCLKAVDDWKAPPTTPADQFATQQNQVRGMLDTVIAMASTSLKDYPAEVAAYKALLALNPNDATSSFRLGAVDMQLTPPNANEGFWDMARSIALKVPNDAQVKTYMKNQLLRYQQQPACDKLVDQQLSDLITMAAGSATPPATLNIPSAADLDKARNDVTNFIPALKAGGDAGKVMWIATCGAEYPDVAVRVMETPVADGDNFTFHGYTPQASDPDAAQKEIEAATDSNFLIHVIGQPEVKRVMKDDVVRFTGTVTDYSQSPFLLTWDKAKINAEDIPDEKAGPAKKGAKKAPAKKAPTQ